MENLFKNLNLQKIAAYLFLILMVGCVAYNLRIFRNQEVIQKIEKLPVNSFSEVVRLSTEKESVNVAAAFYRDMGHSTLVAAPDVLGNCRITFPYLSDLLSLKSVEVKEYPKLLSGTEVQQLLTYGSQQVDRLDGKGKLILISPLYTQGPKFYIKRHDNDIYFIPARLVEGKD
jgi:hypothetical protein